MAAYHADLRSVLFRQRESFYIYKKKTFLDSLTSGPLSSKLTWIFLENWARKLNFFDSIINATYLTMVMTIRAAINHINCGNFMILEITIYLFNWFMILFCRHAKKSNFFTFNSCFLLYKFDQLFENANQYLKTYQPKNIINH